MRLSDEFRKVISYIGELFDMPEGQNLKQSRLRNQADFYSLFAGIAELSREGDLPPISMAVPCLDIFLLMLDDESKRQESKGANQLLRRSQVRIQRPNAANNKNRGY